MPMRGAKRIMPGMIQTLKSNAIRNAATGATNMSTAGAMTFSQ
jgi:hypothetical protein